MDVLVLLMLWLIVAGLTITPFFYGMPLGLLIVMIPLLILATIFLFGIARDV